MIDLLLPRTDAGVLVQLIVATVGFAAATWAVRHRHEWRLLVIGLWVMAYAFMGVRAIH